MAIPIQSALDRLQGPNVQSPNAAVDLALEAAGLRPPDKRRLTKKRPVASYGPRGLEVVLTPIPGVTQKGVFEDGKPFKFQASPIETFGEETAYQWNDYNTVGGGQHSAPIGRSLNTVSFDTLFVDWQAPWTLLHHANWVPDPRRMVEELRRIKDSGRPMLLTASVPDQDGYDVNYGATLRALHWEKRAGEVDAIYVSAGFVEFSSPEIQSYIAGTTSSKLPTAITMQKITSTSATLASLAKQFYGDPSKANVIAAANGMTKAPQNEPITAKFTHRKKILIPRLSTTGAAGKTG